MATVSAAITFIQESGGWVVAEGIEEPRMLTRLVRPGLTSAAQQPVIAGQGFLLGRPGEHPVGFDTHLDVLDQFARDAARDRDDLNDAFRGNA